MVIRGGPWAAAQASAHRKTGLLNSLPGKDFDVKILIADIP